MPEFEDAQLLAYLDGELDQEQVARIEQSAAARARAAELVHLQENLSALLHRGTCPDPLVLGEYQLELLPADEAEAVVRHLDGCPHCTRELMQMEDFLAEVAPDLTVSLLERVKVLIARLVPDAPAGGAIASPLGTPALAGVRGGDDGPLVYEAGDYQVTLEVQEDAARPGCKTILGLVLGAETEGWQAHLWHDGTKIASADVDELGNVAFNGLEPAIYELIIGGPDVEIHIQEVEV